MKDTLVLCYHAISASWPADMVVTPQRFRRQIGLLARCGYRGVTFREAATTAAEGRRVAVTFDDAYRSVIERGLEVLDEHEMPATVFATTMELGPEQPLRWPGIDRWLETPHRDEMVPMSSGELLSLIDRGWEVGSHTRSHPHLTSLDDETLQRELSQSRADCERQLGVPCLTVAYPYGDCDDRVARAAARSGFEAGAALPARWPARPERMTYPRVGVYQGDSLGRFALKALPPVRAARALAARLSR